jgi:hypothetical protein
MLLGVALATAASMAACGGGNKTTGGPSGTGASGNTGGSGGMGGGTGNHPSSSPSSGIGLVGAGGGCATPGLDVQPSMLETITVAAGQTMPSVQFTATLDCMPANAGWGVDLGNVGSIPAGPSQTALFSPTGNAGGTATITATLNGKSVQRQVLVKLTASQNGPNTSPGETGQMAANTAQLTAGGGVGGVGGEGLGGMAAASDVMALGAPTGNGQSQGLTFLYPYDKTVWPRGLPAPLLMWQWSIGDADAVKIDITTTSGAFTYSGTFGRPTILGATGKFIRMPIPQDVWDMATNSAGGTDQITVGLTVAKGGMAYGPIAETWTIAKARLSGTIYYQSYGTQLAHNLDGAVGGNKLFGGAVLSIHVGDTAPKLAAGANSTPPDSSGCRVCHSVASGGSRLIVQQGVSGDVPSSAYDLSTTPPTEHPLPQSTIYPAMYPDGSLALSVAGQLFPLPTETAAIATTGLTSVVTNLGQPAFSPDGKMIVFNPLAGSLAKLNQSLYVMNFDKATSTFSGATLVAQDTAPAQPSWPAFFPDSKSVVYHHQTTSGAEENLSTRAGANAQIYWTSTTSPADVTPLDNLNGKGYLPKLAANANSTMTCGADSFSVAAGPSTGVSPDLTHSDDVDHNYEPTVNPVASGGYAWVVFTSRRMYGNEATIPPYCSDPRGVDLIQNITPKKLWVAAVDLSQKAGTDSSHPAFYLPAQELLAGNARGFWTLDPCPADGTSCMTGDQCCNGYCEAGDGGALVCSNTPPAGMCSNTGDKCTTASDCCDSSEVCVGGFCAQKSPT